MMKSDHFLVICPSIRQQIRIYYCNNIVNTLNFGYELVLCTYVDIKCVLHIMYYLQFGGIQWNETQYGSLRHARHNLFLY